MSEILLVNPRRRARRKSPTRRRRARASNPARRKRRASPVRRRRASVSRRRRRNPAPRLNVRSIQSSVMNAVPGAAGALALDVALGFIPIPANFKTGLLGYGVKGMGAVLIGMLAGNVVKAQTATRMTEGALTVMIHGALKQGVSNFLPNVPMSEYMGYYGAGWDPNYSMGAYLSQPQAAIPEMGPDTSPEMSEYFYDYDAESF